MHNHQSMHPHFEKLTEHFYRALYTRIAPAEAGLRIMDAVSSGALNLSQTFTLSDVFAAVDLPRLADDLSYLPDPLAAAVDDPQDRAQLYVRLALHTMINAADAILDAKCVFEDERGVRYVLTRGDLDSIQKRSLFLHPVMGYEVEDAQERTFLEFSIKDPV